MFGKISGKRKHGDADESSSGGGGASRLFGMPPVPALPAGPGAQQLLPPPPPYEAQRRSDVQLAPGGAFNLRGPVPGGFGGPSLFGVSSPASSELFRGGGGGPPTKLRSLVFGAGQEAGPASSFSSSSSAVGPEGPKLGGSWRLPSSSAAPPPPDLLFKFGAPSQSAAPVVPAHSAGMGLQQQQLGFLQPPRSVFGVAGKTASSGGIFGAGGQESSTMTLFQGQKAEKPGPAAPKPPSSLFGGPSMVTTSAGGPERPLPTSADLFGAKVGKKEARGFVSSTGLFGNRTKQPEAPSEARHPLFPASKQVPELPLGLFGKVSGPAAEASPQDPPPSSVSSIKDRLGKKSSLTNVVGVDDLAADGEKPSGQDDDPFGEDEETASGIEQDDPFGVADEEDDDEYDEFEGDEGGQEGVADQPQGGPHKDATDDLDDHEEIEAGLLPPDEDGGEDDETYASPPDLLRSSSSSSSTSSSPTFLTASSSTAVPDDATTGEEGLKRRLVPEEDLAGIRAIVCERVPPIALKQSIMEKHFSKFGTVTRIYINLRNQSATIHFSDHKSAKKAKERGLLISQRIPEIGAIFYKKAKTAKAVVQGARGPGRPEGPETVVAQLPVGGTPLKPHLAADQIFPSTRPFLPPREPAAPQQPLQAAPQTLAAKSVSRVPANKAELLEIMQSQALTDADRYQVLEARDKYMKELRQGQSGEVKLRGSCPDMCPEKERYSRSAKNQLRWHEKVDGLVNHKATVKEYSRSSADQDVPLSHELRPPAVLKMTMDHLLCNVVNRIDNMKGSMREWYQRQEGFTGESFAPGGGESIADWFEFIWSTTRAIRKDITQQDLTDPVAVDLVEKCARFHIACAERLVEQDSHNFDRKLNDENLTKCIQTLKHLYYDLSLEGLRCPNQPEFRAYDVLLNMNDGDILRSVQTLEPWVRESPEVVLALNICDALNTNNYVKFFRLVRRSSLLQGCILLRYFNQVRRRAIDTIVRAYGLGRNVVEHFSLSKLTHLLGFEDDRACALYCSLYGLRSDPSHVFLERAAFYYPEEVPPPQRARNLIESKRKVPWAAVVNGGTLPSNPYPAYKPHNSFDDRGYLRKDAFQALDQVADCPEVPETAAAPSGSSSLSDVASQLASERILDETVQEMSRDVARQVWRAEAENGAVSRFLTSLVNCLVEEVASEVGQEVLREAKNEELKRRIRREEILCAIKSWLEGNLVGPVFQEMASDVASEALKESIDFQAAVAKVAPRCVDSVIQDVLDSELSDLARSTLAEMVALRSARVEELCRRQKLKLLRRSFKTWRSTASKARKRRNTLDNFPACPGSKTLPQQVEALGGLQVSTPEDLGINSRSLRTQMTSNRVLAHMFKLAEVEAELTERLVLRSVDLVEDVGSVLSSRFPDRPPSATSLTFKLLLVDDLGEDEEGRSGGRAMVRLIQNKLVGASNGVQRAGGGPEDQDLLCLATSAEFGGIHFVVRRIDLGALEAMEFSEKKRRDLLQGTNAILYTISSQHPSGNTSPHQKLYRLLDLLGSSGTRKSVLPLAVLDLEGASPCSGLDLQGKVKVKVEGSSGGCNVFNWRSVMGIHACIKWLAEEAPNQFPIKEGGPLRWEPVKTLAKTFIHDQVVAGEMVQDAKDRRAQDLPDLEPNSYIDLINSALDYLVTCVRDPDLLGVSWPVPEVVAAAGPSSLPPVYWNEPDYLDRVCRALLSLKFPKFRVEASAAKPSSALAEVKEYYSSRLLRPGFPGNLVFEQRLDTIMENRSRDLERRCRLEWGGGPVAGVGVSLMPWSLMPWRELAVAFIDYRLASMGQDKDDPFHPETSGGQRREMVACVFQDAVKAGKFSPPKSWVSAKGHKGRNAVTVRQYVRSMVSEARAVKLSSMIEASFYHQGQSSGSLQEALDDETALSKAFEERLRSAAASSPVASLLVPEGSPQDQSVARMRSSLTPPAASSRGPRFSLTEYRRSQSTGWDLGTVPVVPGSMKQVKYEVERDLEESLLFEDKLRNVLRNS